MTRYSTTLPTVLFVFGISGLLGYTNSQENVATSEIMQKVSNVVDSNLHNISGVPDLNNINTTVIIDAFKQKCDKNGGEGAYENALNAKDRLEQCLKSFVNITKLEEEMERYKPSGDLDIVFKSYCQKTPVLKKCVSNFTKAIEPCLDPAGRKNKDVVLNVTDSLLNFVCYKEGDHIALFISAGGPECIQSKQQEIQNCINSTLGSYIPSTDPSALGLDSLPPLLFNAKECSDIFSLQNCVVKELEKCSDPTPANIVDSIFKFILKVTPCQKYKASTDSVASTDSAISTSTTSLLLMTSLTFLLLRFI